MKRTKFINYVCEYYCTDGIFGDFFDNKLTREMVIKMLPNFLKNYKNEFVGDSIDREKFRDYLGEHFFEY